MLVPRSEDIGDAEAGGDVFGGEGEGGVWAGVAAVDVFAVDVVVHVAGVEVEEDGIGQRAGATEGGDEGDGIVEFEFAAVVGGPGAENGGNSGSGNTSGGSQSGNSGSGSNTGDSTGGNTSGDGQQSTYNLTIARSGSGTSTVTDDSENVITGQRRFAPGTNLNIEIVPAEGQIPTARLNYNPIELTENDGTYTGSFQMPAQGSVLELNSGSNGSSSGDDWIDTGD